MGILTLFEIGKTKSRLYCTFVQVDQLDEALGLLKGKVGGKIFVLDIGKEQELVVTYNLIDKLPKELVRSTVLCHRHKLTNTIYTINALNTAVRQEAGTENKEYRIDWNKYQNSLLVVQNKKLVQFKTKITNIL